jgi:hypothetical protein
MNPFPALSIIWAAIFPLLAVLLLITFFDFLIGVVIAAVSKTFKWDYLLHYLNTDVLPILAWLVIAIISYIPAELLPAGSLPPIVGSSLAVFAYGMYTTIVLSILKSLFDSFKEIGILRVGGVIPEPPQ